MEKEDENSLFRINETHNIFLEDDDTTTSFGQSKQFNSERLHRAKSDTFTGFNNFGIQKIFASQDTPLLRDSFKPRKIRRSRSHMNPRRDFMDVDEEDSFRRKKQRNSLAMTPMKSDYNEISSFTIGNENMEAESSLDATCYSSYLNTDFNSFSQDSNNIVFLTPTREELSSKSMTKLKVEKQVSHINLLNIKLLALDFDQTFLSIHTKGVWRKSAACLAQYVRPVFKAILPPLLRKGVILAIVSFSPQLDLIERVLNIAIKQCCIGKNVFICGGENPILKKKSKGFREFGTQLSVKMFFPAVSQNRSLEKGKCSHLKLVLNELLKTNRRIHNSNILYIDDDPTNIALCRDNTPAIQSVHFKCCNSEVEAENWLLNKILEL